MKKQFLGKLNSKRGASIVFALFLFLICSIAGSIVLASGSAAAGRVAKVKEYDRRYYSVQSAAQLFIDELDNQEYVVKRKLTTTTTTTSVYLGADVMTSRVVSPVAITGYAFTTDVTGPDLSITENPGNNSDNNKWLWRNSILSNNFCRLVYGDCDYANMDNYYRDTVKYLSSDMSEAMEWYSKPFPQAISSTTRVFTLTMSDFTTAEGGSALASSLLYGGTNVKGLNVKVTETLNPQDGTLTYEFTNAEDDGSDADDTYTLVVTFTATMVDRNQYGTPRVISEINTEPDMEKICNKIVVTQETDQRITKIKWNFAGKSLK